MVVVRIVLVEVEVDGGLYRSSLSIVLRQDIILAEQGLEHHRMGKLSTRGCPPTTVLFVVLGNIYGIVHKGHTIVRSLMFEVVAILLTEVNDCLDDLRCCVGNLDRVGLDMRNRDTKLLLTVVLEIDHE